MRYGDNGLNYSDLRRRIDQTCEEHPLLNDCKFVERYPDVRKSVVALHIFLDLDASLLRRLNIKNVSDYVEGLNVGDNKHIKLYDCMSEFFR